MKKIILRAAALAGFICFWGVATAAEPVTVHSLKELASHARMSGHNVRLAAGVYRLTDYLTADSIAAKVSRRDYQYLTFSGNDNVFELEGVEIEIDTRLRERLRFPIHTSEIMVTGDGNTLRGLKIVCTGDGLSPGGATLEVSGAGNTIEDFDIRVRGSFPYAYGDLFGKGGPDVIRHQKQSGFLITGSGTRVFRTRLIMRSFGHGFYIQKDASDVYLEDCYVEGEMRSTDDILAETSGPAFDVNFRTVNPNREGVYRVSPGYMKSLCEDGFRTYGQNRNIRFKNCTAKNTRGGFELRTNGGIVLENCTVIGVERGFWFGNGAVARGCRGDAQYGPLLFMEGSDAEVEIEVLPAASDRTVHALATIQGGNNRVTLTSSGENRSRPIPILVGYSQPAAGEAMSPYREAACTGLILRNTSGMPVTIGEQASDYRIIEK